MHFIDGKGYKSELKSKGNCLNNHRKSKSCHLLFMTLHGSVHTHADRHSRMKVISRNQVHS